MSKNSKKSNVANENSSFLRSINQETKAHFDSLLKKALHKDDLSKKELNNQAREKTKFSKNKFIDKESKTKEENKVNNLTKKSPEESPKINFILEKFLSDAVNANKEVTNVHTSEEHESNFARVNSITFIKPPVPLPRSLSKTAETFRNLSSPYKGTYSVCSPILNNDQINDIERISNCSNSTYDVENPRIINKVNEDDAASVISTETYSIPNSLKRYNTRISSLTETKPVGEIEIHNNISSKSIVKVVNRSRKSSDFTCAPNIEELLNKLEEKENDNYKEQFDENYEKAIEQIEVIKKTKKYKKKVRRTSLESARIKEPIYNYEDLIGIVVYKTDKLLLTPVISKPCVKIHIVDGETGTYLSRSKEVECNGSMKINNIYPLITKSYELQQHKSLIPYWEELIVFDEDFGYILENKESVIIFFEILDFLSFNEASLKYKQEGCNSGWHVVAWAFLKITSKTGELNIDQKLRLQLYKPKKSSLHRRPNECILFDWWKNGPLPKYPSTLHVSVKSVKASFLKDTLHSDAVLKSELHLDIIEKEEEVNDQIQENICCEQVNWSRTSNQPCKIPNNINAKFKSGKKGCFAIKFSNAGLLLACGIAFDDVKNVIIIYSVVEKQEYCKLAGHQGIIYNLFWSSDDKYLISSSADCTVYVWNVYKKQFHAKQVLPHPSFVYCAILQLQVLHIITGCYDQVLRVWKADRVESNYELLQELQGHSGYITSLCFGENKNVVFSSDSVGILIEWNLILIDLQEEWTQKRILKIQELQRTLINNIVMHPGGKRMLVFCRENTHRMIDLNIGCITQWYRGMVNFRVHTNGTLSPCGCLIFAPSEDGSIFIWNTDTGALLASFNPYMKIIKHSAIPHILHYHPLDNFLAISHYGTNLPILLCTFENNVTKNNLLPLKTSTTIEHYQNFEEKIPMKESPTKKKRANVNKTNKKDFNTIIDKIDDVIVTAKTNLK